MPQNQNATIRYKVLDRCFKDFRHKYYNDELIEACASAFLKQNDSDRGISDLSEELLNLNNLKNSVVGNDELMSYFNQQNSRDDVKTKFDEQVDSELLNFINTKLELYNKLSEDRANTLFKNTWFNKLYDNRVIGIGCY